jgi:hypothetical protein
MKKSVLGRNKVRSRPCPTNTLTWDCERKSTLLLALPHLPCYFCQRSIPGLPAGSAWG